MTAHMSRDSFIPNDFSGWWRVGLLYLRTNGKTAISSASAASPTESSTWFDNSTPFSLLSPSEAECAQENRFGHWLHSIILLPAFQSSLAWAIQCQGPLRVSVQMKLCHMFCWASVAYSTSYFHESSLFMGDYMWNAVAAPGLTFSMFGGSLEHRKTPVIFKLNCGLSYVDLRDVLVFNTPENRGPFTFQSAWFCSYHFDYPAKAGQATFWYLFNFCTRSSLHERRSRKELIASSGAVPPLTTGYSCIQTVAVWPNLDLRHDFKDVQCSLPLLTFLASAYYRAEAENVRQNTCAWHVAEQFQRLLPLFVLLASTHCTAEADDVWVKYYIQHKTKYVQCVMPLSPALAGTNSGIEANDVRQKNRIWHCCKQNQGLLPLTTLLTGSNGGIEADTVCLKMALWHGCYQAQGLLPLHALLTGTYGYIKAYDVWLDTWFGDCMEQTKRMLPQASLLTRAHRRTKANDIKLHDPSHGSKQLQGVHPLGPTWTYDSVEAERALWYVDITKILKEIQGVPPLLAAFTRHYVCTEAYVVFLDSCYGHEGEQTACTLPSCSPCKGTGHCCETEHILLQGCIAHRFKESTCMLPQVESATRGYAHGVVMRIQVRMPLSAQYF